MITGNVSYNYHRHLLKLSNIFGLVKYLRIFQLQKLFVQTLHPCQGRPQCSCGECQTHCYSQLVNLQYRHVQKIQKVFQNSLLIMCKWYKDAGFEQVTGKYLYFFKCNALINEVNDNEFFFSQSFISFIIYHEDFNIAVTSSMQDTCHTWTQLNGLTLHEFS